MDRMEPNVDALTEEEVKQLKLKPELVSQLTFDQQEDLRLLRALLQGERREEAKDADRLGRLLLSVDSFCSEIPPVLDQYINALTDEEIYNLKLQPELVDDLSQLTKDQQDDLGLLRALLRGERLEEAKVTERLVRLLKSVHFFCSEIPPVLDKFLEPHDLSFLKSFNGQRDLKMDVSGKIFSREDLYNGLRLYGDRRGMRFKGGLTTKTYTQLRALLRQYPEAKWTVRRAMNKRAMDYNRRAIARVRQYRGWPVGQLFSMHKRSFWFHKKAFYRIKEPHLRGYKCVRVYKKTGSMSIEDGSQVQIITYVSMDCQICAKCEAKDVLDE
jgi:hypothetical protein